MPEREKRVAELLKREVSLIILKEIEWPKGVVATLTHIRLSKDLRYADIYFISIPDDSIKEVLKILSSNVSRIQGGINKRFNMRPVPKIRFKEDISEYEAAKIDEIIENI